MDYGNIQKINIVPYEHVVLPVLVSYQNTYTAYNPVSLKKIVSEIITGKTFPFFLKDTFSPNNMFPESLISLASNEPSSEAGRSSTQDDIIAYLIIRPHTDGVIL